MSGVPCGGSSDAGFDGIQYDPFLQTFKHSEYPEKGPEVRPPIRAVVKLKFLRRGYLGYYYRGYLGDAKSFDYG